jgi:hypothetical protein
MTADSSEFTTVTRRALQQVEGDFKSRFTPAAQQATRGVSQFKEQLGRARETAMFFTASVAEFGPAGRTAQMALAGLAGAVIGGGGVLVALNAAQAGVRLLAGHLRESAEEADRARKAYRDWADDLASGTASFAREVDGTVLKLRGATDAQLTRHDKVAPLEKERSKAERDYIYWLEEEKRLKAALAVSEFGVSFGDIERARGEAASARLRAQTLAAEIAQREALAAALAEEQARATQAEAARRALSAIVAEDAEKADEAAKKQIQKGKEITRALQREQEETNRILAEGINERSRLYAEEFKKRVEDAKRQAMIEAAGTTGFEEEGARLPEYEKLKENDAKEGQDAYNKSVRESIELAGQWGASIGKVIGAVVTGQMTAAQAFAAIGEQIIQTVVQAAIASITADAARAGAGAAASQSGIPVVGPVLAISAMGAVMSAVLGLLGSVEARAAGGPVSSGQPYLVGERGPEIMVPGRSGAIVPNHALGGDTFNVSLQFLDSASADDWLARGGGDRVVRYLQRRRRDGRAT